ncbi:uncharacterized protein PG986_003066 [Apiospora aurea]|uniref:Uncharacterized protein n=1 Tax=Apiospora aurea TaxID=335848 RepID=A0ABR1QQL4_9PEZI
MRTQRPHLRLHFADHMLCALVEHARRFLKQRPRCRCRRGEARDDLSAHEYAPQRDRVDKGAHHPLVDFPRQRLGPPELALAQRGVARQPEGRVDGSGVETAHGARGGRPADLGLEALEYSRDGAGAGPPKGLVSVVRVFLQTQGVQERGAVYRPPLVLERQLPAGVDPVRRRIFTARAHGVTEGVMCWGFTRRLQNPGYVTEERAGGSRGVTLRGAIEPGGGRIGQLRGGTPSAEEVVNPGLVRPLFGRPLVEVVDHELVANHQVSHEVGFVLKGNHAPAAPERMTLDQMLALSDEALVVGPVELEAAEFADGISATTVVLKDIVDAIQGIATPVTHLECGRLRP